MRNQTELDRLYDLMFSSLLQIALIECVTLEEFLFFLSEFKRRSEIDFGENVRTYKIPLN